MQIDFTKIGDLQESTFFDKCKIGSGSEFPCGYADNYGSRNFKDPEVQYTSDATFRMSNSKSVETGNMITLTEKSGKSVNIAYRVVNVGVGTGIWIVKCQKVED